MYMCICISNFLHVFPDILTPDMYQNDLSCRCNWECPCKYGFATVTDCSVKLFRADALCCGYIPLFTLETTMPFC